MSDQRPAWIREFDVSLVTTSQVVFYGNVHDRVPLPDGKGGISVGATVTDAIWSCLKDNGYDCMFVFDPVDKLHLHGDDVDDPQRARDAGVGVLGAELWSEAFENPNSAHERLGMDRLPAIASSIAGSTAKFAESPDGSIPYGGETIHSALVIDFASRIAPQQDAHTAPYYDLFRSLEKLAWTAGPKPSSKPGRPGQLYNPIIWLLNNEHDLPDWYAAQNDRVRVVSIPLPHKGQRELVATRLAPSFGGYEAASDAAKANLVERFTDQTEGMTISSMLAIKKLAQDERLSGDQSDVGIRNLDAAIRCHRVGVTDDPWSRSDVIDEIKRAESDDGGRVLGQPAAMQHSLDVLKRSALGLTGAHMSAHSVRPRGVLFFAGPTGVGKTEMAKAIAEIVFGDQDAMSRFDMSEFGLEHTAQRLIGAPPGYVGFDSGGELTNAVRSRPQSVLLFDEIEKAHPKIFDSFLQILEDGRLTDGRGSTVYFTESIIVFTSNLGCYREAVDDHGNTTRELVVFPDSDREHVQSEIRKGINHFFVSELGRPELLNRLGSNIVVFDFLDPETLRQICKGQLGNVKRRFEERHNSELKLSDVVVDKLMQRAAARPEHGGRAVGDAIEVTLTNPLGRKLFEGLPDTPVPPSVHVTDITETDLGFEVELA